MDSFSSYHIDKGGNAHSLKIKSHRSGQMTERGGCDLEHLLKHLHFDHLQANSGQVRCLQCDLKALKLFSTTQQLKTTQDSGVVFSIPVVVLYQFMFSLGNVYRS